MKRVKLIDVANKAGVSKSTASQYLNGRFEYMSQETKEKIRCAIEELNYVPNPIARSLKTEKTNLIGVIVHNITGVITSNVLRGIDDYCKKQNYNVLIYNTDYNPEVERKSINTLKSLRADGLIITSSGSVNALLNQEERSGLPIVHIHREFDDLNVNTVLSDYYQGAFSATEYLIRLGHRRIGVITRPYESIPSRHRRIQGYQAALTEHGIAYDSDFVCISNTSDDIKPIYESFMNNSEPPTAIFSMFSEVTVDLLNYLNINRINVPDDISIIAFDDLPLSHLLRTPLTAVNQSAYELGEKAAELMISKIENKDRDHENVTLPCELIIRDSCRKIET